jgi:hypothetical protein
MNRQNEEFINILYSDTPISFFYFVTVLNFFDKYKVELDIEDLKIIVDKVEECRLYLNKDNTDPMSRESISPNPYEYLEEKIKDNNKKDIIEWKPEYAEQHLLTAH